jgi:serine phosphatase RsbU (regulator of sigma subunit)
MAASPTVEAAPRRIATPLRLVCTEVWGGNRPIDAPVDLPGVRGRIYSRPCAGGRGGDIHYLSVCSSGLIARACLADVMGHGQAVATVGTHIHHLLRRYMNTLDQRSVLARLNRTLSGIGLDVMTTAAMFTYLPPGRRLSVSYAGHPPGWLYRRAEDRWVRLGARDAVSRQEHCSVDLPLAVDADAEFTRIKLRAQLGDRLLLITDGVIETPSSGGLLFGTERLESLLNERRREPVPTIADALLETLVAYAGPAGLVHDDVTLLIVEFVPGPPGPAVWQMVKNRVVRPHGNSADEAFADPRDPACVPCSG